MELSECLNAELKRMDGIIDAITPELRRPRSLFSRVLAFFSTVMV